MHAGAGPKHMVNGKLQASSLDVYIAMEFGSDGDLFNLRYPSYCWHAPISRGFEYFSSHSLLISHFQLYCR